MLLRCLLIRLLKVKSLFEDGKTKERRVFHSCSVPENKEGIITANPHVAGLHTKTLGRKSDSLAVDLGLSDCDTHSTVTSITATT